MKTLRQANVGDTVRVVRLHGEGAVRRRILDMGITRGTEVFVCKVAPLGIPSKSGCGVTRFPSAKRMRKILRSNKLIYAYRLDSAKW